MPGVLARLLLVLLLLVLLLRSIFLLLVLSLVLLLIALLGLLVLLLGVLLLIALLRLLVLLLGMVLLLLLSLVLLVTSIVSTGGSSGVGLVSLLVSEVLLTSIGGSLLSVQGMSSGAVNASRERVTSSLLGSTDLLTTTVGGDLLGS